MTAYEYTVIPAPAKGMKVKGVKTAEARFAFALQELMNQMGADGWEYQRAETLPSTERAGLTGSTTNWRHVLVFRRAHAGSSATLQELKAEVEAPAVVVAAPAVVAATADPVVDAVSEPEFVHAEAPEPVETTVVRDLEDIDSDTARRDPPLTSS